MTTGLNTAHDVIKFAKEKGCQFVDLKFIDLPGMWQHYTLPISELNESLFEEGNGFDGSSIRGFQLIHESDMLLFPDPTPAMVDPILDIPTLSLICDVRDPLTGANYSRDPRNIAKKAEAYLKTTGIADASYWGPELEFFIFNSVRFEQNSHIGYYSIDSQEGIWNSGNGEGNNLGYRPRHKEGYFPVPPTDQMHDIRTKIALKMMEGGLNLEKHHHEVATAGQAEFDIRFDTLTQMADNVLLYKYIAKNVAMKNGYTVTFMPKPMFQDNGSGMHVHQSLWKGNTNQFFDKNGYAMLSDMAKYYIGGLLAHSPALLAFCAPTTNSYRTLVPGYEAPINLVFSQRNRSASVRIPLYTPPAPSRRDWNTAAPTPAPTLTWLSRLCCWQASTESRTRSTRASRWIKIFTICVRKKNPRSNQLRVHCSRFSTLLRKTMTSYCRETYSLPT
jgi:glutamine synthetase